MTDLRQTSAWANYLKLIGWQVEKIGDTYYFLKKVPILGYLLKVQRPQKIDFKAIDRLTKKYKVWKVVIEPLIHINKILSHGFKLSNSPHLPTKTLQIDLRKPEKEILKEMKPKTRYNIRLALKKGIKVKESKDMETFVNFWRENFERKRFLFLSQKKNVITLYKAFGRNADLLLAFNSNQVMAGLLILRTKDTAYYMYAAANDIGRELFAPTLLTWKGILLAKKNKCKAFDFDGIYDERFPIKTWLGFTKFKKGFGGYEVKYPGCFMKNCLARIITL